MDRTVLYVEIQGYKYAVSVNHNVSDTAPKCWTMLDAVEEGDRLTYKGEEIGQYTFDDVWNETSSDVSLKFTCIISMHQKDK